MSRGNLVLPGGWWSLLPEALTRPDAQLRDAWVSDSPLAHTVRLLTESPWMEALYVFALLFFVGRWLRRHYPRQALWGATELVLFAGLFEALTQALKHAVGRVKPFLLEAHPPLSFPSAHAANTAFLASLIFFSLPRGQRGPRFVGALAGLSLLVGLSRVWVGQHYPLDVLGGWIWGLLVGALAARLSPWTPAKARPNPDR